MDKIEDITEQLGIPVMVSHCRQLKFVLCFLFIVVCSNLLRQSVCLFVCLMIQGCSQKRLALVTKFQYTSAM